MEPVKPIEETDPEFAELLRWFCNLPKKPDHKIGRNDICYCGSGLKYKKCCGKGG